ncbi:hypothetical protein HJFPF1_00501 [Paramyrothecium foliicola]|nr:hypothetical protein HJFPF1_00501 [Paramyrothecium foliicola]
MPAVNHIVLASGAVMAVSVAVATAIAIYESPELRRYADDVRRRIAMAFHTVGDGINPPHREPLFNRPEDSEGFLQSRRGPGAEPGVDADDETRRRQRDELLYWNSIRLRKQQEQDEQQMDKDEVQGGAIALENRPRAATRGSSFDDFLRPDASEQGAFVFKTGTDVREEQDGLRKRRDGARSLNASLYANPFADEHHLDVDEVEDEPAASSIAPGKDEVMSDIYSATTRDADEHQHAAPLEASAALVDVGYAPSQTESSATLDNELTDDEYVTAGQDDRRDEAYASIQAWAQGSTADFYSPLPVTPIAPVSEPELVSTGELTPTDSVSLVGSGEDVGNDAISRDGDGGRMYDVMSESEGMATPASWSEVGSVVSDNDIPLRV